MNPRLFFIHIQKTAGGTVREYISENLPLGSIYPDEPHEIQSYDYYWNIKKLRSLTPERISLVRAFMGHFPYIAAELVSVPVTTLTVLRDPIERTISYLKMRAQDPERQGMGLEEIYNHPFDFSSFIHNHQTKIFAMRRGGSDKLGSFMDHIEIDEARLEHAKKKLKRVDILGLQEDADALFSMLGDRFGWPPPSVENQHVSKGDYTISDAFRARIAADNAADIEFYEFAQKLYYGRQKAASLHASTAV